MSEKLTIEANSAPARPRLPIERPPGTPAPNAPTRRSVEEMLRAEKADSLVMGARVALRRDHKEQARADLQQAFALDPTNCGAFDLLGDIFLEEGEQEKAIQVFERGLKHHPRHTPFEEKIALAHIDLEEMKRDQLLRQEVLQHGDRDKLLDRKPQAAFTLSLMLPGMGQFYNEENERGIGFLAALVVTFGAWFFPLTLAVKDITEQPAHPRLMDAVGMAFDQSGGAMKFWLWTMILAWIAVYVLASIDAWMGAERANTARRRSLGL